MLSGEIAIIIKLKNCPYGMFCLVKVIRFGSKEVDEGGCMESCVSVRRAEVNSGAIKQKGS